MKRMSLSKDKRTAKRLELCSVALWILQVVLILSAVFLWPPICLVCGVPIAVYGALHIVAAYKGWDQFYSFYVGGMADPYRTRHTHTIITGILCVLIGIGMNVTVLLAFFGVISLG